MSLLCALGLYLRRFLAYTDSLGAREDELTSILINCLSDEVLMSVERHLRPDLTFDELSEILRQELGDNLQSREEFKMKLRKALRSRGESVRAFYIRVWNLGRRAYPEDDAVRDNAIRDAFINGIADPQIAARLREEPDMNNEALMQRGALLYNCKASSTPKLASSTISTVTEQPETADGHGVNDKLDTLIDLMSTNLVTQPGKQVQTVSPNTMNGNTQYQYQGPRTSIGLTPNTYYPAQNAHNSIPQGNTALNSQQQYHGPYDTAQYQQPGAYNTDPWNGYRPQQFGNFQNNTNYRSNYGYQNQGPRYSRNTYQYQDNNRQYNQQYNRNRSRNNQYSSNSFRHQNQSSNMRALPSPNFYTNSGQHTQYRPRNFSTQYNSNYRQRAGNPRTSYNRQNFY